MCDFIKPLAITPPIIIHTSLVIVAFLTYVHMYVYIPISTDPFCQMQMALFIERVPFVDSSVIIAVVRPCNRSCDHLQIKLLLLVNRGD